MRGAALRGFAALGLAGLLAGVGCVMVPSDEDRAASHRAEMRRAAEDKAREVAMARAAARAQLAKEEAMQRAQLYKSGCPPVAPPASGNSVGTAADWVELKRSRCADGCPAYTVRVSGDGRVMWIGEAEVQVKGQEYGAVDSNEARKLFQRLADRGYWGLCSQYGVGNADWQTLTTTLDLGGRTKAVTDSAESAPSWLRGLDDEIDQVGETHQWRHGEGARETFAGDHAVVDAVKPKKGVTPLMKAAAGTNLETLGKQLKLLTNVNEGDSSGWTALMYAAQAGTLDGMKLILDAGGDARARTMAGESVMAAAVSAQQQARGKVQLLYDRGLDVNARDRHGVSPLMLTREFGWRELGLYDLLLKLGADVQMRDDQGRTVDDYWPVGVRVPFVVSEPVKPKGKR
jgi:Domain of unknown function (DUF6438)/Ankyrin repeats (3 copies)